MDAKDAQKDSIVISMDEVTPSHLSRFLETTDKLDVLVDVDKNLWVTEGVPVDDIDCSSPEVIIPDSPHVFMAHRLLVNDEKHKNLLLTDVPVIFAHGYRDGFVWKFANGQPVSDTVEAYNGRAKLNNSPTIEFVISCNQDATEDDSGIKIKDLTDKHIVQAVGENVHGWELAMSSAGRVSLNISVDGEFWNLDDLVAYKSINILPNIDQNASKA
jgi:hypothetical protein